MSPVPRTARILAALLLATSLGACAPSIPGAPQNVAAAPTEWTTETIKNADDSDGGGFTFQVGEDWYDSATYDFLPGGKESGSDTAFAMISYSTRTDATGDKKSSLGEMDQQYRELMSTYFVDFDSDDMKQTFKEIKTGTIGDFACVLGTGEFQKGSGPVMSVTRLAFFFDTHNTGLVSVGYSEAGERYEGDLAHVVGSVKLVGGGSPTFTGTAEPIPDKRDKSALVESISKAQALNKDEYESSSVENLEAALKAANDVVAKSDAHQVDYELARFSLDSTMASMSKKPKPEDYRAVSFDDLARYPDEHTGEKVKVSGKVLQAAEDSLGGYTIRLAMDGSYGDVVMVTWYPYLYDDPTPRILEDDKITVYATSTGLGSYTTVLGAENTLPHLFAEMVTID